jgi:orotate phosphoribosyltransferase-like protein
VKINTSYLHHTQEAQQLKGLIDEIAPKIVKLRAKLKFDTMAFRGFSGASVAYPLSYVTGIPVLLVRKTDTNGHLIDDSHGFVLESDRNIDINKYIIIDDFIFSGNTCREIVKTIDRHLTTMHSRPGIKVKLPKLVGIVLYTRGPRSINELEINDKKFELAYIANPIG